MTGPQRTCSICLPTYLQQCKFLCWYIFVAVSSYNRLLLATNYLDGARYLLVYYFFLQRSAKGNVKGLIQPEE